MVGGSEGAVTVTRAVTVAREREEYDRDACFFRPYKRDA